MKRSSRYDERDYAFGQAMLTLRTNIGLTQAGLADLLHVSRRAVAEWEAGSNYPKAEHLKQLIALAVQQQAFPAGREAEEIRVLWQAAHQRVLFDEIWLRALLAPPTGAHEAAGAAREVTAETVTALGATGTPMPARTPAWLLRTRIDWIGALGVSGFQGREVELAELSQWILQEHCRLITILGMGGIGKSALVSLLGQQLAPQFEIVLWRSVRDAPSCEELVADAITFCSEIPPSELPVSLERRIDQLVARLQKRRCLLVLDNLETLLEERDSASTCRWVGHAHTSLVSAVCWSPDGTRLATCSDDHTVRLWQAEDGILLQTLQGHSKDVASIVWSPDGRFLASCGHDGVTHIWEMQSAAHLCTLRGDRPYERLAIVETTGLNEAQKTTLRALGAIEEREGLLKA